MLEINYKLKIGEWTANSAGDPHTEFVALETNTSMRSLNEACRISIYVPPPPQPALPKQATRATTSAAGLSSEIEKSVSSVQVRDKQVKLGNEITIELTNDDKSDKVITARVQSIYSSFNQIRIVGITGMQKLVHTCLNQVYENQSMKQIVSDLADQAGVSTGDIEMGSTYPYFVVYEAKNVLAHILELAMRDGLWTYLDTDNKLTMQKFNKSRPDHTFCYGIDILDLHLFNRQPEIDHVRVYGESPASNQGTDTWHWLVKDLSPFQSDVGDGGKLLAIQDRAIRTKDTADQLATAKYGAITDQATWGRLKILGNPTVKVADAIEIKNVPQPQLNGLFKVTSVRHILNKQSGYLTFVDFTGQGGTEAASGLLSGAAGAISL